MACLCSRSHFHLNLLEAYACDQRAVDEIEREAVNAYLRRGAHPRHLNTRSSVEGKAPNSGRIRVPATRRMGFSAAVLYALLRILAGRFVGFLCEAFLVGCDRFNRATGATP